MHRDGAEHAIRTAEEQRTGTELGEVIRDDRTREGRDATAVTAARIDHAFIRQHAAELGERVVQRTKENVGADDGRSRTSAVEQDATETGDHAPVRGNLELAARNVRRGLDRVGGIDAGEGLGRGERIDRVGLRRRDGRQG